ncbi:ROK family protein [Terrabacter sp. C0L_2]|uniref:ROK family protein n=1 Tax=Terrabacter sp. C0L_2 TaxID=3108389 RepID=UPI002ED361CF|nr:ROK family protein [Terrabacter sp. C0L_2]
MYVGVDIGGTKLLCRAVDADGHVVAQRRTATGPEARPAELDAAIDAFVEDLDPPGDPTSFDAVRAVGVAVPVGTLLNDVRAALTGVLTEQPQVGDVAVVVVGTGIATAFTGAGQVHAGANGWAGELGSIPLVAPGPTARRPGTLDELASGAAVLKALQLTPEDVTARARAGDPEVRSAITAAGQALGAGLATLVCLVNPRLVVLAGGTLAYPGYVDAAIEAAAGLALPDPWLACAVQVDPDPDTLVVRGATHAARAAAAPV